jgi:hypothetical protein
MIAMKKIANTFFVFLLLTTLIGLNRASAQGSNRRGNPGTNTFPQTQFYCVDSDDDLDLTPTYNFVDTLYGTWTRVTGFSNNDDGYALVPSTATPTLGFQWYTVRRFLPSGTYATVTQYSYITTNGFIGLDTTSNNGVFATSPTNAAFPNSGLHAAVAAPLWGDWEFRTTGDSSKVFVRAVADSFYVSYYNLALKGTNGKIRATFQATFTDLDSSVTFHYRSFDGSIGAQSAAQIIQNKCTIGVQNSGGVYGTTYLDRGQYYATSNSSAYAQNLHNQLAVKFIRRQRNLLRVTAITSPASDHYELTSGSVTPAVTIQNLSDSDGWIMVQTVIRNVGTNTGLSSRLDSIFLNHGSSGTLTQNTIPITTGGSYKMTVTASFPHVGTDSWPADNTMSRTFVYIQSQTFPFYDDFSNGLNYGAWTTYGADVRPGDSIMTDPVAPRRGISGALVLDRLDANGAPYILPDAADTITSAPINLAGKTGVWLHFIYQRGLKTDSTQAGISTRVQPGPERQVLDNTNTLVQAGDTLFIEGIQNSASALNPSAASWIQIAALQGGIDVAANPMHIALGSGFMHDHFRLRFRLRGHNQSPIWNYPYDDADSWIIDGIQIVNATTPDLSVLGIDLGNGIYTHLPRNVVGITPKIRVNNNGGVVDGGVYVARVVIKDQLNRLVYYRTKTFDFPSTRKDSLIPMPQWDIRGSQGGVFSVTVSLEQMLFDYQHANDTNTFLRTMNIDDTYAVDDNAPDSAGTMKAAHNEWYYDFTPLANDSLRGADIYQLDPNGGNMSITVGIKKDTINIATRFISLSTHTGGWQRGTFTPPVLLSANQTYRIHFTMTSGAGIGGDASKAYAFQTIADATTPTYGVLHPEITNIFLEPGQVSYASSEATNGAGGGLLIPMARLVFAGSSTALPVDLIRLASSRQTDGSVAIEWKTAKEESVAGFELERNDAGEWKSICTVAPKGLSLGGQYAQVDREAPTTAVTYRLMERDLDGTIHQLGTTTAAAIGSSQSLHLSIYPNPATSRTHLEFSGAQVEQLRLIDALGRVVREISPDTFHSGLDLDMIGLASGVYTLEATSNGKVVRQQITLAH